MVRHTCTSRQGKADQKMTDRFCAFFPCRNFDRNTKHADKQARAIGKSESESAEQSAPTTSHLFWHRQAARTEGEEDFTSKDPYLLVGTRIFFVFCERSCRNLPIYIYIIKHAPTLSCFPREDDHSSRLAGLPRPRRFFQPHCWRWSCHAGGSICR